MGIRRNVEGWMSSSSFVDKMCFTSTSSISAHSTRRRRRSLSIVIGDDVVGGMIPEDHRGVRETITRRGINERDEKNRRSCDAAARINATRTVSGDESISRGRRSCCSCADNERQVALVRRGNLWCQYGAAGLPKSATAIVSSPWPRPALCLRRWMRQLASDAV